MSVREQINADLKTAMRAGDTDTRDTLRSLNAAIKQTEVDSGEELDDSGVMAVLSKQAKQRRESIVDYEKAGRSDLVVVEQRELAVIERYLPQMMSRAEIEVVAAGVIEELGVTDVRGMGQVMGRLMPQLRGKADGRLINEVVNDLLREKES
ncbi:MAG: GatB/YqeY domain-containing protein [Anaerolineae bacterium]|nr:GatB/YqeY domain-containing protein [Anaerolineae bacterium]MCO5186971.1 GatB/YqeY domain-containing protein [Anaerolineae bacterium]MCO5199092.1 GatB/YqeY domain-containing protein [Anaerolineae bacterium]